MAGKEKESFLPRPEVREVINTAPFLSGVEKEALLSLIRDINPADNTKDPTQEAKIAQLSEKLAEERIPRETEERLVNFLIAHILVDNSENDDLDDFRERVMEKVGEV